MCGIVGYLGGGEGFAGGESRLQRMADRIAHRGPDDAGFWTDGENEVGFGHRRLSILDLSPAGHQPMRSASGRYVIAFNGEIYNHLLLRKTMEAQGQALLWHGHSDTETLLSGFEAWGVRETVEAAIGMFAIAVWDRKTKTLTLARDRVGEKPLYYGWQGETFLFGSELKALRVHPSFRHEIDRGALCLLLRHNAISAPHCIYKGMAKLTPGTLLTVSLRQRTPALTTYWSGMKIAETGLADPYVGSDEQATDELEILLKDAVRQQMMADVPLGAFLSGGIDSSVIVSLMQAQSSRPVKTFTIGFKEAYFNEAEHAKAVASHLGTDHTELYVTPEEARGLIPSLPEIFDEPFSDSSQIPSFLVSQLARQQVTVSLSGDAGDELFCGYNRYLHAQTMQNIISALPRPLRRIMAGCMTGVPPKAWNEVIKPFMLLMPRRLRHADVGDKLHKLASVLGADSTGGLYNSLVSHWRDPSAVVVGGAELPTLLTSASPDLGKFNPLQCMMALDMLTYLPDDILVKLDRSSMAVSLETRVPFLDHRVVEFAWRLPQALKLREGETKWILRQVLYRHVPKELIERPKMGFAVPIDVWLRGSLRDWAEALLDESRLRDEGYFDPAPIRRKWREHLSGQRNWQHHLWDVLMFQSWLERQKG